MRIGVVALSLAGASAACGHLPPCPAAGGPAWTELQSAHFRLRTDEDPADARGVVSDLERFQAALLQVFNAPSDLDTGRLPVVVVDRGWTDFAPREIEGYFTHALFQPLVVMEEGGELFRLDVVKHELVHYLSAKIVPRQPLWFSEGVACYFQTLEYDARAGRIIVGRPPPDLLRVAQQTGVSNLETIFEAKSIEGDELTRFYAAAWLSVHYLMNHRVDALVAYEKALRTGETPEAAWTAAFGAQTPADLASEIHQYMDGGDYELRLYPFATPSLAAPVDRHLSDADTHATRALLFLTAARSRTTTLDLSPVGVDDPKEAARREVAEALRQEPDHVMAGAIAHFMLAAPIDVGQATAATRKYADDWLAWILLAEARREHGDTAGWNDAMKRGAALFDRSVEIQVTLIERN